MEKPELRYVLRVHPSWWLWKLEKVHQMGCNCVTSTWLCFTLETQDLTHDPVEEPVN